MVPRHLSPNGAEKLVTKYLQVLDLNSPKLYDKFILYSSAVLDHSETILLSVHLN